MAGNIANSTAAPSKVELSRYNRSLLPRIRAMSNQATPPSQHTQFPGKPSATAAPFDIRVDTESRHVPTKEIERRTDDAAEDLKTYIGREVDGIQRPRVSHEIAQGTPQDAIECPLALIVIHYILTKSGSASALGTSPFRRRHGEFKKCAFRNVRPRNQSAAMRLNDRTANRQSESQPARLRRVERGEETIES